MQYIVETTKTFDKSFKKLDKFSQLMIKSWINKNLVGCDDPCQKGKALNSNMSGKWRYRIGDYRLICFIGDDKLVILALNVGHRKEIYDR